MNRKYKNACVHVTQRTKHRYFFMTSTFVGYSDNLKRGENATYLETFKSNKHPTSP